MPSTTCRAEPSTVPLELYPAMTRYSWSRAGELIDSRALEKEERCWFCVLLFHVFFSTHRNSYTVSKTDTRKDLTDRTWDRNRNRNRNRRDRRECASMYRTIHVQYCTAEPTLRHAPDRTHARTHTHTHTRMFRHMYMGMSCQRSCVSRPRTNSAVSVTCDTSPRLTNGTLHVQHDLSSQVYRV